MSGLEYKFSIMGFFCVRVSLSEECFFRAGRVLVHSSDYYRLFLLNLQSLLIDISDI